MCGWIVSLLSPSGRGRTLLQMRLRRLSEDECYARCYGGWEATVRIIRLEPRRPRYPVLVTGEQLRQRFEDHLDAREPDAVPEPEAA